MTMVFDTQNVIATRSGTGWTVDVTLANLDASLTLKDFIVLINNVVVGNADFTKVTQNSIQYNGASISSSTIEVRRRTEEGPIKTVQYGDRFASDDWNKELNRIARRAAEYRVSGVGSLSGAIAPINDPYGLAWATDTVYAPTRKAVYDQVQTVITNYQAADAGLQSQINLRAPIDSPSLTGSPTAPTPPNSDNSTRIQTTLGTRSMLNDATIAKQAPTRSPGDNGTSIATTAFVQNATDWQLSGLTAQNSFNMANSFVARNVRSRMVMLHLYAWRTSTTMTVTDIEIGTVPSGWRPDPIPFGFVYISASLWANTAIHAYLRVDSTTGEVRVFTSTNPNAAVNAIFATGVWYTA